MTDAERWVDGGVPDAQGGTRQHPQPTAMTLVEEQLRVSTAVQASHRVRIRREVVTEQVTVTVAVRREVLRVDQIPLPSPAAASGQGPVTDHSLGEDVFDIVLHEERPVISTAVVPVERIRVQTRVIDTQTTVAADLVRESVDLVQLGQADPPPRRSHGPPTRPPVDSGPTKTP